MFGSFIKEIKKQLYLLRWSAGLLKKNTICVSKKEYSMGYKVRLVPKASKGPIPWASNLVSLEIYWASFTKDEPDKVLTKI